MKNRCFSVLLAFILFLQFSVIAFAVGDPNADGGGGGMGAGTTTNFWNTGNDGIRITVINVETGLPHRAPVDYSRNVQSQNILHFGKYSKIDYRNGRSISLSTSSYICKTPPMSLPTIIMSNTGSNIEAVKQYLCSEGVADMVAKDVGMTLENLISGDYKLLFEPIAYFTFMGNYMAMTAHEAALYDQLVRADPYYQSLGVNLRNRMLYLSHQNLPLAIFLELPDLGFPAYSGTTSEPVSNEVIISSLGMGTVSYEEPPEPEAANTEYRVNTEVITSVTLHTTREINHDSPARVTFRVGSQIYTMSNIVIPAGESQVVWFKWRTPSTPQTVRIEVNTNRGYLDINEIVANVVDLNRNPPPDPQANDRNDGFTTSSTPSNPQRTSARWTVWRMIWHPYWVWIPEWVWHDFGYGNGYWRDHGYWWDLGWYEGFTLDIYTAAFTGSSNITPDNRVPTASGNTMKSGYGVNNRVTSSVTSNAPNSHIAGAQTAVSYFPEFNYKTYWRLLDLTTSGLNPILEFKRNQYSTYNQRSHFSPIWFSDGIYTIYTYLYDAWTPAGMLSMNLNDFVTISGSLYDDWQISPK